jgi:hypothetical protein
MWYFGGDQALRPLGDRQVKGFPLLPGCAVSQDGLHWPRVEGPQSDGAALAGAPEGSGLWDHRLGCAWIVAAPNGALRMYHVGSQERRGGGELDGIQQIGLALSDGDITRWTRFRQQSIWRNRP